MGDRRQMLLYEEDEVDPFLYVYTHWRGSELPEVVAAGLDRGRSRWDDPPYLARVLVSELFSYREPGYLAPDSVTGFGLSGHDLDSDYEDDVRVYLESKRIILGEGIWEYDEFVDQFSPVEQDA